MQTHPIIRLLHGIDMHAFSYLWIQFHTWVNTFINMLIFVYLYKIITINTLQK